ncbi:MAG: flippase-like domain-containing protein [Planctomycetes bacterium]|nr:flippase-like domain-containing protein [Planctomycetota bacterium]
MEVTDAEYPTASVKHEKPSRWEWLPPAAILILAPFYFLSDPGGMANRFAFFVGLGLLPGTFWRLTGRNSWNVHRVLFAASLIALVMTNPALRPDRETWRNVLVNWSQVLVGFVLSFTQPLWGMLRANRLLTDSGVRISHFDSLKLYLSGSFFNMFLPGSTGGDAYRIYAITHGCKTKLAPAAASITLDRLLGLPSLILVMLIGITLDYEFFLSQRILADMIPFISATGVACLALVAYLALAGKARRRADWAKPGKCEKRPGWLRRAHLLIATNVKRPATLPLALFFGFMSHLASIAACQRFGVALGVMGVPAMRYCLIVPLAMSINSIPGAPGGVGQGELAMATLLGLAGPEFRNAQAGVMIMLLFRFSNIAIGLVGGTLFAMGKMNFSGALTSRGDGP